MWALQEVVKPRIFDLTTKHGLGNVLIAVLLFLVIVFFGSILWAQLKHGVLLDAAIVHFAAVVGLPLCAITSLALVLVLETVAGDIDISIVNVATFKGASGPIIMWVICFLAMSGALRFVYPVTSETKASTEQKADQSASRTASTTGLAADAAKLHP